MRTVIIIPARYGSTRFPGKPLHEICGKSLIRRVWDVASSIEGVDDVLVATDDDRIAGHVQAFGGRIQMTDPACANGTERVYQAAKSLGEQPDIIINLQGDAPLTPPWVIQAVVDELKARPDVQVATPATRMTYDAVRAVQENLKQGSIGGTTVVADQNNNALYFSKTILPTLRKQPTDCPVLKHIGLYGYRMETLEKYMSLPETELEVIEGLEQLRFLYHNIPVRVVQVDFQGRTTVGVDRPEDAEKAEEIIKREGELVS